ncbi:DUF3718 domain-containing protein [Thalassotalea agarivorans]|uniref:DUF3718 domain-containing protein n=1 Tax=Thalassotalea agarivorans TaxID=349064 RepID=A0A1I0AR07_THASX|nr:DUF3718 domain-containing protein [Thalassotalea agarivorans]SES96373.1 Protein of unknown function [Thalassotalea agarivorans]
MNKVRKVVVLTLASLGGFAALVSNANAMDRHMETALIDTCKAAKSNSTIRLKNTLEDYRLKESTVALKVMCNGTDIADFASLHGADRTAAKLNDAVKGTVEIIDVAKVTKINVTFEE